MKTIYYASIKGKLPRKRKVDRFEVKMEGETPIEAIEKLKALIKEQGIREAHGASFQAWNCSESEFIDADGNKQTMIFRSVFPIGASIAISIE
jgi:hypothetical protein